MEIKESKMEIIHKEDSILQFLPECMYKLVENKFLVHDGCKLKVDYLVDIVHTMILKYYFKKINRFTLNAILLKEKYGYNYNKYINYLIEGGYITLHTNYKTGLSSRVYRLNSTMFTEKMKRYPNKDKVLLRKHRNRFLDKMDNYVVKNDYIIPEVKSKLIDDLYSVSIELYRSIFFLDSIKYNDYDVYNRNVYSVESINNGNIFYHFDAYGRMHTNYTILKSFIRKNCLMIDGEETFEIDIPNSQPLFLSKILKDSQSKWVDKNELELFSELTFNGKYYKYMMDQCGVKSKKEIKQMTYKVLFGRNMANSKVDINFKKVFPTIHNFIKLYKKEKGDYRVLAYDLQKYESNVIFNKIINKVMNLYPYVKIITVHDSILIQKRYKDIVEDIFYTELKKEMFM